MGKRGSWMRAGEFAIRCQTRASAPGARGAAMSGGAVDVDREGVDVDFLAVEEGLHALHDLALALGILVIVRALRLVDAVGGRGFGLWRGFGDPARLGALRGWRGRRPGAWLRLRQLVAQRGHDRDALAGDALDRVLDRHPVAVLIELAGVERVGGHQVERAVDDVVRVGRRQQRLDLAVDRLDLGADLLPALDEELHRRRRDRTSSGRRAGRGHWLRSQALGRAALWWALFRWPPLGRATLRHAQLGAQHLRSRAHRLGPWDGLTLDRRGLCRAGIRRAVRALRLNARLDHRRRGCRLLIDDRSDEGDLNRQLREAAGADGVVDLAELAVDAQQVGQLEAGGELLEGVVLLGGAGPGPAEHQQAEGGLDLAPEGAHVLAA